MQKEKLIPDTPASFVPATHEITQNMPLIIVKLRFDVLTRQPTMARIAGKTWICVGPRFNYFVRKEWWLDPFFRVDVDTIDIEFWRLEIHRWDRPSTETRTIDIVRCDDTRWRTWHEWK